MAKFTVRVRGKEDFARNHEAYLQNMINQVDFSLDLSVDAAKTAAMSDCPVGTPESTGISGYVGGTLRDGHQIEEEQDGDRHIRYLYNDVEYAQYVHEGTYKMAARPWLLNAVLRTQSEVIAIMSRV